MVGNGSKVMEHNLVPLPYPLADNALFMEVTDEQKQLAQQARMYGEQMQALSDSAGGKKVCCEECCVPCAK